MPETELEILNLFRQQPEADLSTTFIVKNLESDYSNIEKILQDQRASQEAKRNALRSKAQMHRRTLYFLNKLIERDVLAVSRMGNKGEKYFSLKLEGGEELVLRDYQKRKLVIQKSITPTLPIEGYEQKKIAARFEPQTWIERLNAILLDSRKMYDLEEAYKIIANSFNVVNDVIAINDFELLFEKNDPMAVLDFVNKLEMDCRSYNRRVSLILDFTNLSDLSKAGMLCFGEKCADIKNLALILDLSSEELSENAEFFEAMIALCIAYRKKIYIKNHRLYPAPYFLGRAGPYNIPKDAWKIQGYGGMYGLACAQNTISIDVEKFFSEFGDFNITEFNKLIFDAAKSILMSNYTQRRRNTELFEYFVKLNQPFGNAFFDFSRNYLRLWNYGWKKPGVDPNFVNDLLKTIKTKITKFAHSEERIFSACGIPIKFKIAFSIAGQKYHKNIFSSRAFARLALTNVEDLYKKEIKSAIEEKEALFSLFDGGDVMGFHIAGEQKPADVLRMVNVMLNTYKIPFFSLDFEQGREVKLDQFMT